MNDTTLLNTVIFSKDRALQLDSLIRSICDNYTSPPASITILYKYSNEKFNDGYKLLIEKQYLPNINWIEESDFSIDSRNIINSFDKNSFIQFLVDDDIIFKPFDINILNNFTKKDLTLSLRVDRNYSQSKKPNFKYSSDYLKWNWYQFFNKTSGNIWHYPFSVDGNIFHTSDIQKMLNLIDFKAPNSFEGEMHRNKRNLSFLKKRFSIATPNAVLFNNPLNSVQSEGETWNQEISVEKLNDEYLASKRIDNEIFYSAEPDGVHFGCNIKLILPANNKR